VRHGGRSPELPEHDRRRGFLASWHRHPAIPTGEELTLGERAADQMRNGMGSWGFVFAALGFLAAWMLFNRNTGFDPYPFILLNLVLSCLAAMQGAILLIAAKRSDQIASLLAQHDFDTDSAAAQRIEDLHVRLAEMAMANQRLLEQNTVILKRLAADAEVDDDPPASPGASGA
jgi:uncharacterized membrane protein